MQFDDRKAFSNNNNYILIEALKVKINFAFELTIKNCKCRERKQKRIKYLI